MAKWEKRECHADRDNSSALYGENDEQIQQVLVHHGGVQPK